MGDKDPKTDLDIAWKYDLGFNDMVALQSQAFEGIRTRGKDDYLVRLERLAREYRQRRDNWVRLQREQKQQGFQRAINL